MKIIFDDSEIQDVYKILIALEKDLTAINKIEQRAAKRNIVLKNETAIKNELKATANKPDKTRP
jgi:hypothetical protein